MIQLMAVILATAVSSCGTTHQFQSKTVAAADAGAGATASVTIEKYQRIQPVFCKLDGEPLRGSRTIRLSPGKHLAELALDWPGTGRELVSFPLEIPHAGSYSIEMDTFPKKMSKRNHYDGPTLTSDLVDSGAFANMDPRGGIILLPIFAATTAIDMAGVAASVTRTAVKKMPPRNSVPSGFDCTPKLRTAR